MKRPILASPLSPAVPPIILIAIVSALFFLQRGSTQAIAQGQANRARGEYTLVSGRLSLGGPHAVYVLDSSNNEIIALRWNQGRQMLEGIGFRSLATDTNSQVGR